MARQIGKITEATESRTIQVRVEGVTCSCGYPVSMDAGYLRAFLVATGWKERSGQWWCNHCEEKISRYSAAHDLTHAQAEFVRVAVTP